MPTLVKWKYVELLAEQIAAHPDLSDADLAALLSAPTSAGQAVGAIDAAVARDLIGWQETAALQDAADNGSGMARLAARYWLAAAGSLDMEDGADGRDLLDTLMAQGLLSEATRTAILAAATVDVPGPSIAQDWGLGECLPVFVGQVREYGGLTEEETKAQLAALMLVPWLAPRTGLSAAEVLALEEYQTFRDGVVVRCSEIADAAAADAVAAEVLTMLKERDS